MSAAIGFAAHRSARVDAGVELLIIAGGLLLSAIVLLVGAIVQFRRARPDSGAFAVLFLLFTIVVGWEVLSRLSKAYN